MSRQDNFQSICCTPSLVTLVEYMIVIVTVDTVFFVLLLIWLYESAVLLNKHVIMAIN